MESLLTVLLAGFTIGILGSFHCIGMCGPLALALPVNHLHENEKIFSILFYNFGRAISYSIIGAVFGAIGLSFSVFKIEQFLSVFAGVTLFIFLFFMHSKNLNIPIIKKFTNYIKFTLGKFIQKPKSIFSFLYIGILNGFLPCGLVYTAIIAAIATGTISKGSLLMLAFGMGTIPLMTLTIYFGKFISLQVRNKLNNITPYIIGCISVLLILRGLNLGIPYISPKIEPEKIIYCH